VVAGAICLSAFFSSGVGEAADWKQTTVTHVNAKPAESRRMDPKTDELVKTSNPNVMFRISKTSPYKTHCMTCAESYERCYRKEGASEELFETCKDEWQSCIISRQASCSMLKRE
jgi:hypothetical protein